MIHKKAKNKEDYKRINKTNKIHKKSNINVFFGIIITIVTLIIFFIIFFSLKSKTNYCKIAYPFVSKIKYDPVCEELNNNVVKSKESYSSFKHIIQENFNPQTLADYSFIKGKELEFEVKIPFGIIKISSFNFSIKSHIEKIQNKFYYVDDDIPKIKTTCSHMKLNKGIDDYCYFILPKNNKYNFISSSFTFKSSKIPKKVDFAVAIDSSESMYNEWISICDFLPKLKKQIKNENAQANIKVYSLAKPDYHPCINNKFDIENIDKSSLINNPSGYLIEKLSFNLINTYECGNYWCYDYTRGRKYDDTTEAWANAGYYLLNNFNWHQNTKKLIMLISDSDPNGGAVVSETIKRINNNKYKYIFFDGPYLTGKEGELINKVIELQNYKKREGYEIPFIVISGDESGSLNDPLKKEGYGLPNCDFNNKNKQETCKKIISWMKELAEKTNGYYGEFKNTESIKKAVFKLLYLPYPKNVYLDVLDDNNYEFINYDINNEQKEKEFITTIDIRIKSDSELSKKINNYLNTNYDNDHIIKIDSKEYIKIPIKIHSKTEGRLILENLKMVLGRQVKNIDVYAIFSDNDGNNEKIRLCHFDSININQESKCIIKDEAINIIKKKYDYYFNNLINNNNNPELNTMFTFKIKIEITDNDNLDNDEYFKIFAFNPKISYYEDSFIKNLVWSIDKCKEMKLKKTGNFICKILSIPKNYPRDIHKNPITLREIKLISKLLKVNNDNSYFDDIIFKEINHKTNIVIRVYRDKIYIS